MVFEVVEEVNGQGPKKLVRFATNIIYFNFILFYKRLSRQMY